MEIEPNISRDSSGKKVMKKVLLILPLLWAAVTIYFFTQHFVTVYTYTINESMVISNYRVDIKNIEIADFTRRSDVDGYSHFSYVGYRLPHFLVEPFFKVVFFYSRPFTFSSERGTSKLSATVVSDDFIGKGSIDLFSLLDITIKDDIEVHYDNRRSYRHENDSNTISVEIQGDRFPMAKLNSVLTVKVTDKRTGTNKNLEIHPQFEKKRIFLWR